jgi:protein involved in polysaccharide export with SLBB domain
MRNANEGRRLMKGVTYFWMAVFLIWLQASVALAQEPVKVIQPANDTGAAGRAPSVSPKASNHTGNVSIAKPLTLPIPTYPRLAVKYRITGVVKIAVEIDSKGIITSAHALDGPMILRQPAVDAAYLAHFSPAEVGGKPASTNGVINYIFRLADHKTEEVSAVPIKPDSSATFTGMPPMESGQSKVPDTVNQKVPSTEKFSSIPVKPDPAVAVTVMPARETGGSMVPNTVILKGELNDKVNAVKLDPPSSVADKLAGESRKSSVHDIVHLKGAIAEKVSPVPVKSDPAAAVTNKPATESGDSKVTDTLNPKEERKEKVSTVPVKSDPAASVANKSPVESGKPPAESVELKVTDTLNSKADRKEKVNTVAMKPDSAASLTNKPAVEIGESKVPDNVNPDGDKNATRMATVSQPAFTPSSLTTTYRVGVGDILDVRILGDSSKKSTLYSVLEGGVLDYHQAGDPVVGGKTLEEIRLLLTVELKRRLPDPEPKLAVGVRDYASHTVTVSGLVAVPGNKILRREAVPLYVALAEAQPRPEADRVQISCRATGQITLLSLNDPLAMETLVHPGDVINVTPRPSEFYYIAGFVNIPGQKSFPLGITLMQAIMSAGGVSRPNAARIEIGRQGPDGFVSFEKYNLKEIKAGKMKDPTLRPGDRIEVLKP